MISYKALSKTRLNSAFYFVVVLTMLLLVATYGPRTLRAHGSRPERVTLKINNCSKYQINRIYMSPVGTRGWGKDLLGSDTLAAKNGQVTFTLEADDYDVKLVDEDQDECITTKDLHRDTTWCIGTNWLEQCEGIE